MRALSERQRAFVIALAEQAGKKSLTRAARKAGYAATSYGYLRKQGCILGRDPSIVAALQEEARSRLDMSALMAAEVLIGIANDPKQAPKDRRAAAGMLLDRSGFGTTTEHTVKVEHLDRTGAVMAERIKLLASRLGVDPDKLLGVNVTRETLPQNTAIEGEFVVIANTELKNAAD